MHAEPYWQSMHTYHRTKMKWVYSIQRDNQIDYDSNDLKMYNEVRKKEPTITSCMACGSCSATCTAAQFTEFSLRQVIMKVARGETAGIARDVEKCMLCGKCHLACPRGVNTRNVILAVKTVCQSMQL